MLLSMNDAKRTFSEAALFEIKSGQFIVKADRLFFTCKPPSIEGPGAKDVTVKRLPVSQFPITSIDIEIVTTPRADIRL